MFHATPRMLLPVAEQKNTANSPNSSGVVNCKEGSFSPNNSLVASSLDKPNAAASDATGGVKRRLTQIGRKRLPCAA